MSKATFSIIPLILIIMLSVFFFLSPRFFAQTTSSDDAVKEILVKRFINVGNLIAHATFVEDAIIMGEAANLTEIVDRFRRDEPELIFIHFTDDKNKVIASSDPATVGKNYESTLVKSGPSVVKEKNGIFEGGFTIRVGKTNVGAVYFGAKPEIPALKISASPNPIIVVIGVVFGIIVFLIMLFMQRNLEARIVEDINERQKEVFSPKIQSLKQEQAQAEQHIDELNSKIATAQQNLKRLNEECEERKKAIEANPVMQSVEKLKGAEAEILKKLEKLKEEELRLTKEIDLLSQKREEVRSALEAEKKEEQTLHEKLDLIKRKILHLEKPNK